MAGQEGLEPPAAGFGVRSSTIRATGLCPYPTVSYEARLSLGLLVHRVLAAKPAIFLQLYLIRSISLVFVRRIIFALAFTAGKQNNFPHLLWPHSRVKFGVRSAEFGVRGFLIPHSPFRIRPTR